MRRTGALEDVVTESAGHTEMCRSNNLDLFELAFFITWAYCAVSPTLLTVLLGNKLNFRVCGLAAKIWL